MSIALDKNSSLASPIQLVAPGLLDAKLDDMFITEAIAEVTQAVQSQKSKVTDEQIKETIRLCLRRIFRNEIDKKPVIEVLLARV